MALFHGMLGRTRLLLMAGLLAMLVFSWPLPGRLATLWRNFRFSGSSRLKRAAAENGGTHVDLRPWQTAHALAGLATTAEEKEFARQAERFADHEVDQAFASALRYANLEQRSLTGEALAISQRVETTTGRQRR